MPIICITRGALQTTFAFTEALAADLNIRAIAREDVIENGRKYGLDQYELSRTGLLDRRPPAFWDRWRAERLQYLSVYKASLMDFVVGDNVAYVGNIGRLILSDVPKVLRVRLDASKRYRITNRMEETGGDENEAREYVERIDEHREEWVKFLYGVDYYAHANYDLILNLETVGVDSLVRIVAATVALPEFTLTGEDRKRIRDISLESHVLAALARSPRTRSIDLTVKCDSETGRIEINGVEPMVGIEIWKKDITEVAGAVDGVSIVEFAR